MSLWKFSLAKVNNVLGIQKTHGNTVQSKVKSFSKQDKHYRRCNGFFFFSVESKSDFSFLHRYVQRLLQAYVSYSVRSQDNKCGEIILNKFITLLLSSQFHGNFSSVFYDKDLSSWAPQLKIRLNKKGSRPPVKPLWFTSSSILLASN